MAIPGVTGVIIFTSFISIVAIFANLSLLIVMLKEPLLRTASYYFIICLLVVDLAMGIMYPVLCAVDIGVLNDNPFCVSFLCVIISINTGNCLYLLAITVERFIIIRKPLRAVTILTEKRVGWTAIAIAAYNVFLGVISAATPLTTKDHLTECRLSTVVVADLWRWFIFAHGLIPLLVMIAIYVRIFFIVRRHIRSIADHDWIGDAVVRTPNQSTSGSGAESGGSTGSSVPAATLLIERQRYCLKREAKTALYLFSIVFYCALCWIPYAVILFKINQDIVVHQFGYAMSHVVLYTNIAINPFVFGFGDRDIKKVLIKTFYLSRCFMMKPGAVPNRNP